MQHGGVSTQMTFGKPDRYKSLFFLLLLIYLFFVLSNIRAPAVTFEEFDIPLLSLGFFNRQPDYSFFSINSFPLFSMGPYTGALKAYILAPFYFFLGISIESIRLMGVFFGILILLLTYSFTERFFNRQIALLTVLFLITQPVFILYTKTLTFSDALMNFFSYPYSLAV